MQWRKLETLRSPPPRGSGRGSGEARGRQCRAPAPAPATVVRVQRRMSAVAELHAADRSSTAAATRPSRSTCCLESGAPSAAPRCPRAPRPAMHEAVELRDGGDARSAARACSRAVGQRQRRDRGRACARPRRADQGPRPRADRARRNRQQGAPRRERDPRRLAGGRARPLADELELPLWRCLGGEDAHRCCRCRC